MRPSRALAWASQAWAWCGVVWCGVVWCGVVWCGMVWCGTVGWAGVGWGGLVRVMAPPLRHNHSQQVQAIPYAPRWVGAARHTPLREPNECIELRL